MVVGLDGLALEEKGNMMSCYEARFNHRDWVRFQLDDDCYLLGMVDAVDEGMGDAVGDGGVVYFAESFRIYRDGAVIDNHTKSWAIESRVCELVKPATPNLAQGLRVLGDALMAYEVIASVNRHGDWAEFVAGAKADQGEVVAEVLDLLADQNPKAWVELDSDWFADLAWQVVWEWIRSL